jgi:hypothetical protein
LSADVDELLRGVPHARLKSAQFALQLLPVILDGIEAYLTGAEILLRDLRRRGPWTEAYHDGREERDAKSDARRSPPAHHTSTR